MRINPKSVVKKIKAEIEASRKERVNLYLDLKTWKTFQAACKRENLPASIVAEQLMRDFSAQ